MRLPTSVIIAGRSWKVVYDKSIEGGKFNSDPGKITIGKHSNSDEKVQTFLHEVTEATYAMLGFRYISADDMRFVMTHNELDNATNLIFEAIKPILRKE